MAQQTFNNTKINVEFDESTSRQQLNSGENISTLFGKIKKIFSDLKSVCFSGSYNDLSDKPTTATKNTNGLMSAEDKSKLDNADNKYALKSKYGDTTINVGRKAGTDVGEYSTAEGYNTIASGYASHAEGSNAYISNGEIAFYDTRTVTISDGVTVEVDSSQAYGINSHAEGCQTLAYGKHSHAEGDQTTAKGGGSHAEGYKTIASGAQSHAEGVATTASGGRSHAEGSETIASGSFCHAEGWRTVANGNNSCHAEGYQTTASEIATHAEGSSSNKVTDLITDFSWSETTNDDIINTWNTQKFSLAHGRVSHVEGCDNLALGYASHAEGHDTVAVGNYSHTSGHYTKALNENEASYGKYNISNSDTLFSIGDGTAGDARHNAFEITTTGGKLHDNDIATTNNISNPNLLINPNFKINQRNVSGTKYPNKNADGDDIHTYFVDRWGIDSGNVTINSDGTLTLNGTISQILENAVGTNVTASVSAGTAVYDDTAQTFTITGNGDVISWAKLEIGRTATPFSPPNITTERIKCQRYYYRFTRGRKPFASGYAVNTSNVNIFIPMTQMRIDTPDVAFSNIVLMGHGHTSTDTSATVNKIINAAMTPNGISLQMTSSGLTSEQMYMTTILDGGYLAFDAELY